STSAATHQRRQARGPRRGAAGDQLRTRAGESAARLRPVQRRTSLNNTERRASLLARLAAISRAHGCSRSACLPRHRGGGDEEEDQRESPEEAEAEPCAPAELRIGNDI